MTGRQIGEPFPEKPVARVASMEEIARLDPCPIPGDHDRHWRKWGRDAIGGYRCDGSGGVVRVVSLACMPCGDALTTDVMSSVLPWIEQHKHLDGEYLRDAWTPKDHSYGSVIEVGKPEWECACGREFPDGAAWRAHSDDHRPPPPEPRLFATEGERLLHRWACEDSEWLLAIAAAVDWQQRPWWRRVGRTAPRPYRPRDDVPRTAR